MFKYYIQQIQDSKQHVQVENHKSETLLLASSRSHPTLTHNHQHFHMLREDYQGLFYRKLNDIIQLESLQQVLEQNQNMLTQLSNTFLHQIAAKKEIRSLENSEYRGETECGIVLMAKEMVLLHSKVRKQWSLLRKKAELEHQVSKLVIDKKSLVEEIKIFGSKLMEISLENFKDNTCIESQRALLQQARKYNLSKVISNFMGELKEIIIGKAVSQLITNLLKSSSEDLKSTMKIEQLKLISLPQKNRKELINNLTLYLKEFYSSNIYKEFTQSIMRLTKEYEHCKDKTTVLSKKLSEEIQTNVKLLKRVFKEINTKSGIIMDYKIDIQILGEENKLLEKNIWVAEQSMSQCIQNETELLLKEYLMQEGKLFKQQNKSQKLSQTEDYKYFYQQLSYKYKSFLMQHLKKAEQIEKLKEKIEKHDAILASYERQIKMQQSPEQSQMLTHRTLNDRNISIKGEELINQIYDQEQVLDENEHFESASNYQNHQFQSLDKFSMHQQTKQENSQSSLFPPLKELDSNMLSPERITKESKYQSCGEMVIKMTALLKQYHRKQKFIVTKMVNIGGKTTQAASNSHKKFKKGNREYEAKLTTKYLILQPINEETLSICQKIQLSQIRRYTPNYHTATLVLEYASCKVLLNFTTFNMDIFVKKLEKVFKSNSG